MDEPCYFFRFCLLVTGKAETQYLPKLFRSISGSGICTFLILERVQQLRPITAPKRTARMVGTGQRLPRKDFDMISAPARRCIEENPCNRVVLIDDLEDISDAEAQETFERYRQALDEGLGVNHKGFGSVHFLVKMLEAYFFADPSALSRSLDIDDISLTSCDEDVEAMPNPKARLKRIFSDYQETKHPGPILENLDLATVLSRPEHCASLRTCVKWIVNQLMAYPNEEYLNSLISDYEIRFSLSTGSFYSITSNQ